MNKNKINGYLNEMIDDSFKTGDYSKIKAAISRFEQDDIILEYWEEEAIDVLKYFVAQNKKIDMYLFSAKDEDGFKKSIFHCNMPKIQAYLKKYEEFQVFEWIKSGEIEKVSKALKAGLSPNKKTSRGESLLNVAAQTGQTEIVNLLINSGARVNPSLFEKGKTSRPLIEAVEANHTETALLLLSKNAEIMAKKCMEDVLTSAVDNDNKEIVDAILNIYQQKYANDENKRTEFWNKGAALGIAIKRKNKEIVEALLNNGAPLGRVVRRGCFPLYDAIMSQDKNIINLVYEKADKKERARMLSFAIAECSPEVQFHLYQKKCPVSSVDMDKFTIQQILDLTVLQEKRELFDEIMSTLSDDEKEKINWKWVKEEIANDFPPSIKNRIMNTFKEVFPKCVPVSLQKEGAMSFMPMPEISISGNLCDEMGCKMNYCRGAKIIWPKNEAQIKCITKQKTVVSNKEPHQRD